MSESYKALLTGYHRCCFTVVYRLIAILDLRTPATALDEEIHFVSSLTGRLIILRAIQQTLIK